MLDAMCFHQDCLVLQLAVASSGERMAACSQWSACEAMRSCVRFVSDCCSKWCCIVGDALSALGGMESMLWKANCVLCKGSARALESTLCALKWVGSTSALEATLFTQ